MKNDLRNVVIGAGPAGLSCAYELAKHKKDVFVLEKDSNIGGICRTLEHNGYRFDVGPHRFFTKSKEVDSLWKTLLEGDFSPVKRLTRIYFAGKFFFYPIQISDVIKNIGLSENVKIVFDYFYSQAYLRNKPKKSFEDWVVANFGRRLYLMFFKTYTEKVWGISCSEISAEWAAQRIKNLSVWSILKNTLGLGDDVKSLTSEFSYPKYGAGQMYDKMREKACEFGAEIKLNTSPKKIKIKDNRVYEIVDNNGNNISISSLISSMPFSELFELIDPVAPKDVVDASRRLKFRSLIEVCLVVQCECTCSDQWIYIHEPSLKVGRVQIYKNWSEFMVPKGADSLGIGMEYFSFIGDQIWTMTDEDLVKFASDELNRLGIFKDILVKSGFVYRVPHAYPVYSGSYEKDMEILKEYLSKIENIQVIGRGGMFRYNNMDHSMLTGLYAARNIINTSKKIDLWSVNEEEHYHEEVTLKENNTAHIV